MTARRKARKRALDVLFEAEQRGVDLRDLLARRLAANDPPIAPYTAELVTGVVDHREDLDEVIAATLTDGWTLARLPAVDRAVLRLACYELRWATDVPTAVAIDEAVGLATDLSTEQSPGFVNGVLGAVAGLPRPAAETVS